MENKMRMINKFAIALVATSAAVAPIAASAAPVAGSARAGSFAGSENALEGNSSWIIGLVGLLAGITAIVLIADKDDDAPVSP